jgi:hypothetical protein
MSAAQLSIVKLPLAPARQALASAILSLAAASAALERASKPVQRLQNLVAAHARAVQRLCEACEADKAALGAWLAEGDGGDRPAASTATVEAARAVQELAADAEAAALALPAKTAERAQVHAELVRVQHWRDECLAVAALEAAHEVVDTELKAALTSVLEVEVRLRGVQLALGEAANRAVEPIRNAGGCAAQISDLIAKAREEAAIMRNDAGGRDFLNRLAGDPEARL